MSILRTQIPSVFPGKKGRASASSKVRTYAKGQCLMMGGTHMRRFGHCERLLSHGPHRNIALLVPLRERGKMTDSSPQSLGCGPTDLLIIPEGYV